jgi:hypothetical protein
VKNGQKLKLGDAHVTPRNIQEVQASKLGDAPEAPPSSSVKIRSPFKTLYFYCFMHYAFFLERQLIFERSIKINCKSLFNKALYLKTPYDHALVHSIH